MNRKETMDLLMRGKEAWNSWAEEVTRHKDDAFEWKDKATARFKGVTLQDADFSEFVFPGQALFENVTLRDTRFYAAVFRGEANFDGSFLHCSSPKSVVFGKAVFESEATFKGASFSGPAAFSQARFAKNVDFRGSTFEESIFTRTLFQGDSSFCEAAFNDFALFMGARFEKDAVFENAKFEATEPKIFGPYSESRAEESELTFMHERHIRPSTPPACFQNVTFEGDAFFACSLFKGEVDLSAARFHKNVRFKAATFQGNAIFSKMRCERESDFSKSNFKGVAKFENAYFGGRALFDAARFSEVTKFSGCSFVEDASFVATQWESAFSMRSVTFQKVPDFEQAAFMGHPRLDNIKIIERQNDVGNWASKIWRRGGQGGSEIAARWRDLRRIALVGHNERLAQQYYAKELKAERHVSRWWWLKQRNFFGLLYQWLSDFGQSIVKPLAWWVAHIVAFKYIYIWMSFWAARGEDFSEACDLDNAAWMLALSRSFPGLTNFGERMKPSYDCLYGLVGQGGLTHMAIPVIEVTQTVLAAILIALCVLAIRNNFRIK